MIKFLRQKNVIMSQAIRSNRQILFQVTTDLHHRCTEEFKGTSSAAPLAAGMIALALEAK